MAWGSERLNISVLIGQTILKIEKNKEEDELTFFTYVTIRWYGESNGYYSESVEFIKL